MKKRILTPLLITSTALSAIVIPYHIAHSQTASQTSTSTLTATPSRTPAVNSFNIRYTGSLFFLPIGILTVQGNVTDYSYSMRSDLESSGFGKLTKDGGLWSTSIGYYNGSRMRPTEHIIQKLNKKARRIEMRYDSESNPTASIVPRFGSMGVPAASQAERREGVDAMSGILQMMMTGHKFGDKPCTGTIPVFDGKQRYNLRMERDGTKTIRQSSYSGETVRCNVYMETVSGYDPEDLLTQEEASTPLQVYLANYDDAGLYVPVRFDYRISGVKVNIKATDITVTQG